MVRESSAWKEQSPFIAADPVPLLPVVNEDEIPPPYHVLKMKVGSNARDLRNLNDGVPQHLESSPSTNFIKFKTYEKVSCQRLDEQSGAASFEKRKPKKSLSVVIISRDYFDLSREVDLNSNAHHNLSGLDISWLSESSCIANCDSIDEQKNAFIFEERKESASFREAARRKLEEEALAFLRQNEVHPSKRPEAHSNKRKIDDFDVTRLKSKQRKSPQHKNYQVATKAYKLPNINTKNKQFGKARTKE